MISGMMRDEKDGGNYQANINSDHYLGVYVALSMVTSATKQRIGLHQRQRRFNLLQSVKKCSREAIELRCRQHLRRTKIIKDAKSQVKSSLSELKEAMEHLSSMEEK